MTQQLTILVLAWAALVGLRLHTLTRACYYHVKDLIRGDQHAAYLALRAEQRKSSRVRRDTGSSNRSGLHQATLIKVASPARHVTLLPRPMFLIMPARRHIGGVVIRWTPLVAYPSVGWLDELTDAVGHFLGVDPAGLDRASTRVRRKRVRIVRANTHALPDHLPFDDLTADHTDVGEGWRDAG